MNKRREKILLLTIALLLILFRYFLIKNLPIVAINYQTDDRLMAEMAIGLRDGKWLGDYQAQLLMKGAFFPMLLAAINKLGLSYLGTLYFLNTLAALFFVSQLREFLRKPVLQFVLFAILLFDPCTAAAQSFQRVYRTTVTEMEVLFLWGAYYGLYCKSLHINEHYRIRELFLFLLAGFVLWAMWNTREESIWIIPFAAVASLLIGYRYLKAFRERNSSGLMTWMRCGSLLLPFIMLILGNQIITGLNEKYYGEPVRLEVADGTYSKALKSIYSVKNKQEIDKVAVSSEKVERMLSVSPALRQIRPELEAELKRYDKAGSRNIDGEVEDGWFIWGLKYAAFNNGAADSLPKSQAYWETVHQEIEAALDDPSSGLERQTVIPAALMSPPRKSYIEKLPGAFAGALGYIASYRDVYPQEGSSGKANKIIVALFESITNNVAIGNDEEGSSARVAEKLPHLSAAVKWLNDIGDLYRVINPIASAAGLAFFLIMFFLAAVKKQTEKAAPCLIICGMFFSMLILIGGVSYTHVSAYKAILYRYLAGAYPLMLGSVWFSILYTVQLAAERRSGLKADTSR